MEKVDNPAGLEATATVVGLFAKTPRAGRVKTRLCPPLLPEEAASLYATALDETIRRFSGHSFDLVICHADDEGYFAARYPELPRRPQRGPDLGARMAEALQGFLAAGYRRALLIGSDSPDLPLAHIEQAFAALAEVEVVLAPADDGGYVLIGESRHHPQLFGEMPWSSAALWEQTLAKLEEGAIPWRRLPSWEDLDDAEALRRLLQRSPHSLTARHLLRHHSQLFGGVSI